MHAAGAVPAVLAVLQLVTPHHRLVLHACCVIVELADTAEFAERTAAGGAIEAVTAALRAHRSDNDLPKYVCVALGILVQHSAANAARAVRAGAVDELKATMCTHPADAEL